MLTSESPNIRQVNSEITFLMEISFPLEDVQFWREGS